MNAQRAFTVGMIRRLRQFGPLRRRHRIPQQRQPNVLRLEYYKALLPFVHAFRLPDEARRDILRGLAVERQNRRMDSPWWDRWRHMIDIQERLSEDELGKRRLEDVARRFGQRVSSFQREQLDKQVRASLGVPMALIEPFTVDKLEQFAAENASLIKSVSERYHDRIRARVNDAFERGARAEDLAEEFVEVDGMAERDARRIARDQIGKLAADFNQSRQTELGVTEYIWRSVHDSRVRDEHRELDGRRFKWSETPPDGHPGDAVNCRCFAEPVFDEILSDLTE
jgi:SPP1 gp7 family putative phage head morphogenesis protein